MDVPELGSVAAVGQAMYAKIRDEMEEKHWGKMVIIDVKSGDYEIDPDDMTATSRLLKRRPDAYTWGELVGYPVSCSFVGAIEPLPRRSKGDD